MLFIDIIDMWYKNKSLRYFLAATTILSAAPIVPAFANGGAGRVAIHFGAGSEAIVQDIKTKISAQELSQRYYKLLPKAALGDRNAVEELMSIRQLILSNRKVRGEASLSSLPSENSEISKEVRGGAEYLNKRAMSRWRQGADITQLVTEYGITKVAEIFSQEELQKQQEKIIDQITFLFMDEAYKPAVMVAQVQDLRKYIQSKIYVSSALKMKDKNDKILTSDEKSEIWSEILSELDKYKSNGQNLFSSNIDAKKELSENDFFSFQEFVDVSKDQSLQHSGVIENVPYQPVVYAVQVNESADKEAVLKFERRRIIEKIKALFVETDFGVMQAKKIQSYIRDIVYHDTAELRGIQNETTILQRISEVENAIICEIQEIIAQNEEIQQSWQNINVINLYRSNYESKLNSQNESLLTKEHQSFSGSFAFGNAEVLRTNHPDPLSNQSDSDEESEEEDLIPSRYQPDMPHSDYEGDGNRTVKLSSAMKSMGDDKNLEEDIEEHSRQEFNEDRHILRPVKDDAESYGNITRVRHVRSLSEILDFVENNHTSNTIVFDKLPIYGDRIAPDRIKSLVETYYAASEKDKKIKFLEQLSEDELQYLSKLVHSISEDDLSDEIVATINSELNNFNMKAGGYVSNFVVIPYKQELQQHFQALNKVMEIPHSAAIQDGAAEWSDSYEEDNVENANKQNHISFDSKSQDEESEEEDLIGRRTYVPDMSYSDDEGFEILPWGVLQYEERASLEDNVVDSSRNHSTLKNGPVKIRLPEESGHQFDISNPQSSEQGFYSMRQDGLVIYNNIQPDSDVENNPSELIDISGLEEQSIFYHSDLEGDDSGRDATPPTLLRQDSELFGPEGEQVENDEEFLDRLASPNYYSQSFRDIGNGHPDNVNSGYASSSYPESECLEEAEEEVTIHVVPPTEDGSVAGFFNLVEQNPSDSDPASPPLTPRTPSTPSVSSAPSTPSTPAQVVIHFGPVEQNPVLKDAQAEIQDRLDQDQEVLEVEKLQGAAKTGQANNPQIIDKELAETEQTNQIDQTEKTQQTGQTQQVKQAENPKEGPNQAQKSKLAKIYPSDSAPAPLSSPVANAAHASSPAPATALTPQAAAIAQNPVANAENPTSAQAQAQGQAPAPIRLLSKLAPEEQVLGTYGAESRSVHRVREDLSTGVTTQLPSGVEFGKRSIDPAKAKFKHVAQKIRMMISATNAMLPQNPEAPANGSDSAADSSLVSLPNEISTSKLTGNPAEIRKIVNEANEHGVDLTAGLTPSAIAQAAKANTGSKEDKFLLYIASEASKTPGEAIETAARQSDQSTPNLTDVAAPLVSGVLSNRLGYLLAGSTAAGGTAAGDDVSSSIRPNSLWLTGLYGISKQGSAPGKSGYKGSTAGAALGVDFAISDSLVLGLAYSNLRSNFKFTSVKAGDKAAASSHVFSIYGQADLNQSLFVTSTISAIKSAIITKTNHLVANNSYLTAKGKYNSTALSAEAFLTYKAHLSDNVLFLPNIGLKYGKTRDGGCDQTGSGLYDLSIASRKSEQLTGVIGARLMMTRQLSSSSKIAPFVHVSLENAFRQKEQKVKAKLSWAERPFESEINAGKPAKLGYNAGAGFTLTHKNMELQASYNFHGKKKYQSHQGSLKLQVMF